MSKTPSESVSVRKKEGPSDRDRGVSECVVRQ